jgi:hypothetical protein
MIKIPKSAAVFITLIAMFGLGTLGYAVLHFQQNDSFRFISFLAVALLAARLKLKLPGLNGNMSVNLPFIILGVTELGLLQTVIIACASTLMQSVKKPVNQIQWIQVFFNFFNMSLSVGLAHFAFHHALWESSLMTAALRIGIAAGILFLANTVPVSAIISLTEVRKMAQVWYEIFLWSFPYYVLSAGVASIVTTLNRHIGWQIPLLVLPLMFGVYHCYRAYFGSDSRVLSSVSPN